MKIGFLIQNLESGGAERAASSLACEMAQKGVDAQIITFNNRSQFYPLNDEVTLVDLDFAPLPSGKLSKLIGCIKRALKVRKTVKRSKLDALICMSNTMSIYGVFATILTKSKTIGTERNNPYKYMTGAVAKAVRKISSVLSDGFVFQTRAAAGYFPTSAQNKGAVIPNAVFNPLIDEIEPCKNRQKIIYGVGRLAEQKRFDILVDAFAAVKEKHNDYKLVIFGTGALEQELNQKIESLGLSDCALLAGSNNNALKFVANGAAFALTSDFEGMPNVLLEAMAVGVPCVSTRCPMGPEELIVDGENGVLVSVGSSQEIAEALNKIIENPDFADKISKNAREILYTHNISAVTDEWINYAQSVIERK